MAEENISQNLILKDIDETRNYLMEEIKQNDLMNKNHNKSCLVLNYIEQLLILVSVVTGCASISAFAFLVGIPIGITSSTQELKFANNRLVDHLEKCFHLEIFFLISSRVLSFLSQL